MRIQLHMHLIIHYCVFSHLFVEALQVLTTQLLGKVIAKGFSCAHCLQLDGEWVTLEDCLKVADCISSSPAQVHHSNRASMQPTLLKRPALRTLDMCTAMETAPALCPQPVTWFRSPPKFAMLLWTHSSAKRWSWEWNGNKMDRVIISLHEIHFLHSQESKPL